jgi:hypothetical protein
VPLTLDHVVIATPDLTHATQVFADEGFTVRAGGTHANGATHNALIGLADGVYLELLARTGEQARPAPIDFSLMLAQATLGIVGYAWLCDDIEAEVAHWRAKGAQVGTIVEGERVRTDGVRLQWRLALLEGGFAPFFIQDVTPREWRVPNDSHANGVQSLADVLTLARLTPALAPFFAVRV